MTWWLELFELGGAGGIASYVSFQLGRQHERARRRSAMRLPAPADRPPGIFALLPAMNRSCPICSATFQRHPAMVDPRCNRCIAEALDAEDERIAEQAKQWREGLDT